MNKITLPVNVLTKEERKRLISYLESEETRINKGKIDETSHKRKGRRNQFGKLIRH